MIKFYPSILHGTLTAPPSKACALRMMFAASLAATATVIHNVPDCRDVYTAIDNLKNLGCKVTATGTGRLDVTVEPFAKNITLTPREFNFRDSETTARYMIAIASAYGVPSSCQAEGTLIKRAQVSMTGMMAVRGVRFSNFSLPFNMRGHLWGGEFRVDGSMGSHTISALLTTLPVLTKSSRIVFTSPVIDENNVLMTIDILEKYGIKIIKEENGYSIPGQQYFNSPGELYCENDWSLASMWTCASACGHLKDSFITITGLQQDSRQRYRNANKLFPLISQHFKELYIQADEFPELATVIAGFAVARGAKLVASGVSSLRYKETNRLRSFGMCLANFGVSFESSEDGFIIIGRDDGIYPANEPVDTMGDAWLFMSLALAATEMKGPITLKDEHCADKIYKEFLNDFQSLGGKFEIIK